MNNCKITIIMTSGKAHNGKSEFSKELEKLLKQTDKNIIRCSLSTYIRNITKNDFFWDGKDTTEARRFMGEVYRLATELIYPYHMARRVWERDIIPNLKEDNIVIVESLREKNNLDYFINLKNQGLISNVITIRINRPNYSDIDISQEHHISETDMDNYKFDYEIINDGTIEDLHIRTKDVLKKILIKEGNTCVEQLDDIPIPSKVKVIKINNTIKVGHLKSYIGKEGIVKYDPIIKDNIKRWKVIFNEKTRNSAYFRRSELKVIE